MYNYAAAWTMDWEGMVTGWGISKIRRKVKSTSMLRVPSLCHYPVITVTLLRLQNKLVPFIMNVDNKHRPYPGQRR